MQHVTNIEVTPERTNFRKHNTYNRNQLDELFRTMCYIWPECRRHRFRRFRRSRRLRRSGRLF